MYFQPKVKGYLILNSGERKDYNYQCFSVIDSSTNKYKTIAYSCDVDRAVLSQENVDFYIKFLKSLLPKGSFEIDGKTDGKFIEFVINRNELNEKFFLQDNKSKILLILTAFRYLSEFPNVVKKLAEKQPKELADKLKVFYGLNKPDWNNNKSNAFYGHGLIGEYYTTGKYIFTKKELEENLNNPSIDSVQKHFRK